MPTKTPTIYLICGFIGAGKSTFSKKLEEETGAVRITKDEWSIRLIGNNPAIDGYAEWDRKITGLSRDVAFHLAEKSVDVILDEGFWERKTRDDMRKRAEAIGAKVVMYYLDTPLETIRKRVLMRNKDRTKESFEVSSEMLDSYLKYWEPPQKTKNLFWQNKPSKIPCFEKIAPRFADEIDQFDLQIRPYELADRNTGPFRISPRSGRCNSQCEASLKKMDYHQ